MSVNFIYWINDLFRGNLFLRIFIPQRKEGEIFKIGNQKYKTHLYFGSEELGCKNCAFCNRCGHINILKRGFCSKFDRKDKKSVFFYKLGKL